MNGEILKDKKISAVLNGNVKNDVDHEPKELK